MALHATSSPKALRMLPPKLTTSLDLKKLKGRKIWSRGVGRGCFSVATEQTGKSSKEHVRSFPGRSSLPLRLNILTSLTKKLEGLPDFMVMQFTYLAKKKKKKK